MSEFYQVIVVTFSNLVWFNLTEDESAVVNQPVQGSFLNLLPPQIEVPEKESNSQ